MSIKKFNELFGGGKNYNPFDKYKPKPMEPEPIDTYKSTGFDRYKPAAMEPEKVDMSKRGVKAKTTIATSDELKSGDKFSEVQRPYELNRLLALLSSDVSGILFGNDVERIKEYVNKLAELNKEYSDVSNAKSKPMVDIDIENILKRI